MASLFHHFVRKETKSLLMGLPFCVDGWEGTGKTQVVRCLAQLGATITSSTIVSAKHVNLWDLIL